MAPPPRRRPPPALPLLALLLACLLCPAAAFYLPGSYRVVHPDGDLVSPKVNSLTSVSTELPYPYSILPFCKAPVARRDRENLGELLMGDDIEASPYKFTVNRNESNIKLCKAPPLSADDAKRFASMIDDAYNVNMLLDGLPATPFDLEKQTRSDITTGFPIGRKDADRYYIYNHLRFTVLVHYFNKTSTLGAASYGESPLDTLPEEAAAAGARSKPGYVVVGFEVVYNSYARTKDDAKVADFSKLSSVDPESHQYVKEGEEIIYSYDVTWNPSNIEWPSRWDAYLRMPGDQVHWFSILNSLMVIGFLAGMVFVILLRSVHRDLAKIEQLDKEEAAQMADESGWKLVVGDVFRAPPLPGLLCIVVGNGVQIVCMATVTIFFAALGFMSPASRGMLLTGTIFIYLLQGIAAGYAAARLWVTMTGLHEGAVGLALKVACFFPGICFVILTLMNFLLWGTKTTGGVPLVAYFFLLALWFGISLPLTIFGAYAGMKVERIKIPVRTNQIPREIPQQRYPSWLLILGGGILPFGTLYIELYFIFQSIWNQHIYYVFGFLFIVLILLVIVCAEVAVVFTYLQLTMEDYRWWWRSFSASGSVAVYAFLYSINYLIFDLGQMRGMVPKLLYLGYTVLMVLAMFLGTGTIGFLSSLGFVHYLFSSVKLD
eukprot:SM000056S17936  [mRNA]  locus=s56:270892:274274:+ [translate_table: standard]